MKIRKMTLAEFQEILLWQSLNKQIIALTDKGRAIKRIHHKALQSFCFENRLFAKITGASILDETPLSLISDFSNLSFVTANILQWKNLLSLLMPNTHSLDCTKALADSFDVLSKYDRKYNLTKVVGDDGSDDEELYFFINQYTELRKEMLIKDFSDVVKETHRLKSIALKKIISKIEYKVRVKNSLAIIDLSALEKEGKASKLHEQIRHVYVEEYCCEAERFMRMGSSVGRRVRSEKALSFLVNKSIQKGLKKSIKNFIRYEMPLYKRETDLERKYLKDIQNAINANDFTKIIICNVRPFFFLKYPLPLV
jgi:hypothetical protein